MSDWSFYTFIAEAFVAVSSIPFFYLAWASGYVGYMWSAARKNHWGKDLLTRKKSGAQTWAEETGQS